MICLDMYALALPVAPGLMHTYQANHPRPYYILTYNIATYVYTYMHVAIRGYVPLVF